MQSSDPLRSPPGLAPILLGTGARATDEGDRASQGGSRTVISPSARGIAHARSEDYARRAVSIRALLCALTLLLASCTTCGDPPCAGAVHATAELRGFVGPIVVVLCMNDACTGNIVGAEECAEAGPAGTFPFPADLCYFRNDAGPDGAQLRIIATGAATSAFPSGAMWSLSVRSMDGLLQADAALPAVFAQVTECDAQCLSGAFDFGTMSAVLPRG